MEYQISTVGELNIEHLNFKFILPTLVNTRKTASSFYLNSYHFHKLFSVASSIDSSQDLNKLHVRLSLVRKCTKDIIS